MICKFKHNGLCCNSGSIHYEYECKNCECIVPISNAERIRSMTDEELAVFLDCFAVCHYCSEHERLENEPLLKGESCDEQCEQHLLNWLKRHGKEDA